MLLFLCVVHDLLRYQQKLAWWLVRQYQITPSIFKTMGICVSLIGCSDHSSDALWQDYQMRIENVFKVPSETLSENNALPPLHLQLPSRRDRIQSIEPPSISLWQLLKLQDCELNRLLAKRNAPLGKVMLPSQYLIYAKEFIRLAEMCLDTTNVDVELATSLRDAISFYKQHRRVLIQNALFHEEFAQLFHPRRKWNRQQTFPSTGIPQLDSWQAAMEAPDQAGLYDAFAVEVTLQQMANQQLAGHWLAEIESATEVLKVLNERMSVARSNCPTGKSTSASQIMQTVFQKYFAGQIQPWVSELFRFGQGFQSQFEVLVSGHTAMTAFYKNLFIDSNGPWIRIETAWRDHVSQWQSHLKSCGQMPSVR